ncbi:MAG: sigma-54-dependent Fis family transcriptional regulator [Syntrophaceae bacterium]|nr:sigma-54-dependent Fis family transcriptional regulator [Syntrophaceae bacterium]
MKRILIVDNDEPARTALAALLRDEGYEIDEATTEIEAMQLVERRIPDLVVSDLCAPDCFCVGLLHWIKEHHPHLDVIIVTAFGSIDCVVKTIKMGALNYVMKPVNNRKFLEIVREALHRREGGMQSLRRVNEPYCYLVDEVVGVSRSMEQVLKTALRVTDVDSSILIRGESGTGKELIARILHNRSTHRRNRQFVAINCAAIPGEILESELFGSVRGAFTGATQTRKGLIEVADGGTLFMDEIGDTSPQFQSKLLRVIQEKEIRRVGDTASRSVDVRIVAATNRDLKKMIGEGTFREDLYYRLSVIDIIVPPLRERKEDIQPLVDYFLQDINGRLGTGIEGVSAQAMAVLMAYPWPGNVRELRNSLERAALLSGHKMLKPEDFPLAFEHYLRLTEKDRDDEIIPLKEMERRHLLKAMQKYNYNQKLVAKKLGIGYTTLWRKLKESEKDFNSTP